MLDRLRETVGRLPEVVKYRDWKAKQLEPTATRPARSTRTGGICSTAAPSTSCSAQRPDGGLTYLYDDETERFALESRYNALIDVQRETLDSLKEGVAVFGTDGRLKLFNSALAEIWRLSRRARSPRSPHIDEIIAPVAQLYDDLQAPGRASAAPSPRISDQRQALRGPDGAARPAASSTTR